MANSLTTNQDRSKVFLGDNKFDTESYYNNSGYDPVTLLKGTVMGRLSADGNWKPVLKGANNGSQYPIGILAEDYEVDAGATVALAVCVEGDVAESKVIFWDGQQTLDTVLDSRQLRDHLKLYGVHLLGGTEMTDYDNQ